LSKKRIAVIGKGTAGSQAAAHFNRFFPDDEIVWYFDSNKPVQSVGEGSTLELPRNLYNNIGFFNSDLKKVNGNFKTSIYKENWGSLGNKFFHDFPPPQTSYHFSATELQDYVHEYLKDKVKIIDQNVNPKEVDADFILNASGKPDSFDDYYISEYIPVNAAHVVQCPWNYPRFDYTLTMARKHGWVFGIPLGNRCSIGYIYNKDINSVEDLQEEMHEIFEEYDLSPAEGANNLSFNNYCKKENFEMSGRIASSGNSSFFLEPLEATSIGTMDFIQRLAFDVWNGTKKYTNANDEYLRFMHETELVLMLHYAAGLPFDTAFWREANKKGLDKIKNSAQDHSFKEMYGVARKHKEMRFAPQDYPPYGPWWSGSFVQNLHSLDLFDTIDQILS